MKLKTILFSCLVLFLFGLSSYQLMRLNHKNSEIDDLRIKNEKQSKTITSLRSVNKRHNFKETLLSDPVLNKVSLNFDTGVVSIIPINSCSACIEYDAVLLGEIQNNKPDNSIVFVVTNNQNLKLKPFYNSLSRLTFFEIETLEQLILTNESLTDKIKNPVHIILIDNEVVGVHFTSFYYPERTKRFFKKFNFLI